MQYNTSIFEKESVKIIFFLYKVKFLLLVMNLNNYTITFAP